MSTPREERSPFATLEDVIKLSGRAYSAAEQERIEALLPVISDALREEAERVDVDLDAKVAASASFANTAKLVAVDIVVRAMRQSTEGDPLSQESQSGLGYSWSGTYSIPGGGISNSIMKNDLKRLGLRRQKIGAFQLWRAE